jgi:K+-sensing histidine kinase KdpD
VGIDSTGLQARYDQPGRGRRDAVAISAAFVGPLATSAALAGLRRSLPNTDAALVLVLVVVAVAAFGNRFAGYLAAASAAVWFDFFLTVPYERFTIERRADLKTTVLLLVIGVAVCELAVWGRRQAALASGRAAYLAGIREAAEVVAVGGSGSKLVQDVSQALVRMLGLKSCLFERGVAGVGQPARLRHDGDVEWQGQAWDVDRRGLPQDTDIELLVESGGHLVGRFLMRADADSHPSRTQRVVAVVLAGQVSGALGQRG